MLRIRHDSAADVVAFAGHGRAAAAGSDAAAPQQQQDCTHGSSFPAKSSPSLPAAAAACEESRETSGTDWAVLRVRERGQLFIHGSILGLNDALCLAGRPATATHSISSQNLAG